MHAKLLRATSKRCRQRRCVTRQRAGEQASRRVGADESKEPRQVSIKLVRNQYPFDVNIRRGLRGGAHNYPPPEDEEQERGRVQQQQAPAEPPSRKFVQGIPSLYSRAPKKDAAAGKGGAQQAAAGHMSMSTAERLLIAAQKRADDSQGLELPAHEPSEPARPPAKEHAPQARSGQAAMLEARLRAMVPPPRPLVPSPLTSSHLIPSAHPCSARRWCYWSWPAGARAPCCSAPAGLLACRSTPAALLLPWMSWC